MTDREPQRDWRHRAACLDEDPELFFPLGWVSAPALAQIERAKQVCAVCPVKAVCLEWALDSGQDAGVWGGLSEDERRTLCRARRRAARYRTAVSAADGDGDANAEAAPREAAS